MKTFDIELKAQNTRGLYWAVGPTVTVLEQPGWDDKRRFLCLTDILNDCKHVEAVKDFLSNAAVEGSV